MAVGRVKEACAPVTVCASRSISTEDMEVSRQLPKTLEILGEVDILKLVVEKDSSSNRGRFRGAVRRRGGAGLLG